MADKAREALIPGLVEWLEWGRIKNGLFPGDTPADLTARTVALFVRATEHKNDHEALQDIQRGYPVTLTPERYALWIECIRFTNLSLELAEEVDLFSVEEGGVVGA